MRLRGMLAVAALSGCALFEAPPEPTLPGTREPALATTITQAPNPEPITLGAPIANPDWPQPGGHPSHAAQHLALGRAPAPLWQANIDNIPDPGLPVLAPPIVADGMVYVLNNRYHIKAFNIQTGTLAWQIELPVPPQDQDAFGGGLAFHQNTIYASTGFARLFAINTQTQSIAWQTPLPAPARAAPSTNGRLVVTLSIDNQTTASDPASGDVLWQHVGFNQSAGIIGSANAAIDERFVLTPYSSGEVFALLASNGRVIWSDNLSQVRALTPLATLANIRALPVIHNHTAYVTSHAGRTHAIDMQSGGRLWQQPIGASQTPWIAGDYLFMLSNDARLVCLRISTGDAVWSVQLDTLDEDQNPMQWSAPTLAGGQLFLGNALGELIAFDPQSGRIQHATQLSPAAPFRKIVARQMMFTLSNDGTLTALR